MGTDCKQPGCWKFRFYGRAISEMSGRGREKKKQEKKRMRLLRIFLDVIKASDFLKDREIKLVKILLDRIIELNSIQN